VNINPNKLTITQLFAIPNEQFIVPSYQRRYAWKENQYKALFDDIQMLKANDGHLFGTVILQVFDQSADLNKPELVDGQQRMTSLVILLKALESVFQERGEQSLADDTSKLILCRGLDGKKIPKVKSGDLDNPDLEKLILHREHEDLTNKNLGEAYLKYYSLLQEMNTDEVKTFFSKLTSVAVVIRLDVAKPQDAYKLFETINNRGLQLSPTDIVKNFLLGHAAKINDDVTLEAVKSLWSEVIVNLDGLDSDDFLRQYICSVLGRKIPMSKLVLEFKKYYMKTVRYADLLGEYEYYYESGNTIDSYYGYDDEQDAAEYENGETISPDSETTVIDATAFLKKLRDLSVAYREISLSTYSDVRLNASIKNLNDILSKPTYIFLMHFLSVSSGDGGNPSPSGEAHITF